MVRAHDDDEHGQHIEQGARYEKSGVTDTQRDQLILQLADKGCSQRQISRQVGMTQVGVSYALRRLQGVKRNRATYDVCDYCGETWPTQQLNRDGLCFGVGTNNCAASQ